MQNAKRFTFAEMAVALLCSKVRLESDIIRLKRLCESCGLSDMGTVLAIEAFENDVLMVKAAGEFLRDAHGIEREVRMMLERKQTGRWPRIVNRLTSSAALI